MNRPSLFLSGVLGGWCGASHTCSSLCTGALAVTALLLATLCSHQEQSGLGCWSLVFCKELEGKSRCRKLPLGQQPTPHEALGSPASASVIGCRVRVRRWQPRPPGCPVRP